MSDRRRRPRNAKKTPARQRPTTKAGREAERKEPAPVVCSEKENAFIDHWLTHFNGSKAIVDAGIHDDPLVAKVYACEYLKRPHVAAEILQRRAAERHRLESARERVLAELLAVSVGRVSQVTEWMDGDIRIKAPSELTDDQLAAIQGIEITPTEHGTRRRVMMHPKVAAGVDFLKLLGPTDEEIAKRAKSGGLLGSGGQSATIVIAGGPTGLEVTVTTNGEDDAQG